jgi:hypothetical protein
MAELGPCNISSELQHSFGSIHFHLSMVTWTETWWLSKYCNPAIWKVGEMVKPDVPIVALKKT